MSQSDFVSRGQTLVASGQYQEAVKVCRLGLLGRPTTVEGRIVLGQALLALKRFDEVLAEMRVALELDHSAVGAHTLKAEALLKKGDAHAAIEALHAARAIAPGDARVLQLLGEAEHGPKASSAAHPAAGFVGAGDTKHYPNQPAEDPDQPQDLSEGFTKPTSISSPNLPRRTASDKVAKPKTDPKHDPTPSPEVLAVGDKSGTVEVDPDLEGVELDDDLDFDDLAAPPAARSKPTVKGAKLSKTAAKVAATKPTRGKLEAEAQAQAQAQARRKIEAEAQPMSKLKPKRPGTVDLEPDDDSDVIELDETRGMPNPDVRRASSSAVRNAVKLPSGPIDVDEAPSSRGKPRAPHAPLPAPMPAHELTLRAPGGPPAAPLPPAPRISLAAAMPTVAAMAPPQNPAALASAQQLANAQRKTMAIAAPPPPLGTHPMHPALQNNPMPPMQAQMYQAGGAPPQNWSVAAAHEPTMRAPQIDPHLQVMMDGRPSEPQLEPQQPSKTGMRKTRSKLSIVLWVVVGIVVIGGGVFAGFQIRSMRLQKQIVAARQRATDLAKSDTWTGWTAARDSLAGIVQASATAGNRAALARARALIAYEFGESTAEAKPTVDGLAGQGGLDGDIAAAYLALAQSDPKAAKLAADAAIAEAPNDAGASYVAGQAALLAGDPKAGVKLAAAALDKEARPLYALGVSRAQAASYSWDESLAAIDRAFTGNPDQPAAVIQRAVVLAAAGRLAPGAPVAAEVRTQLEKLIAEGKRPSGEQPHGVSPAQVAFADLALARVDFARGDAAAAHNDINAAAAVNLDDQRFAETAVETLIDVGETKVGEKAALSALENFPGSRRARLALAQIELDEGRASDALDLIAKSPELSAMPVGLALRGQAKLAAGDTDGARADFDAALSKQPNLEPAIVGQAWLDIATGDVDAASKLIDHRITDKGAPPAIAIVGAAILRRGDDAAKAKAKAILEKLAAGAAGAETPRAELELGRLERDLGDFGAARKLYASASQSGNADARLEGAVMAIDDRDPAGGRETLDTLLKAAGDKPTPELVLETARARMLVGDHAGAAQLLETADKLPGVVKWKLLRERGRLFLRRGDFPAAVTALGSALETCGDDAETFLLAADAATSDEKSGLADKIRKLLPQRLKARPEAQIVNGKLLLDAGKDPEAEAAYRGAKDALKAQKAPERLIAQADYGLAVVAYNKQADPEALAELNLVIYDDPSLYDAYLFKADLLKDKKAAYEQAQIAVKYNPDYPRAWHVLGKLAAKNNDKATLADAIAKLTALAPTSPELQELEKLRR